MILVCSRLSMTPRDGWRRTGTPSPPGLWICWGAPATHWSASYLKVGTAQHWLNIGSMPYVYWGGVVRGVLTPPLKSIFATQNFLVWSPELSFISCMRTQKHCFTPKYTNNCEKPIKYTSDRPFLEILDFPLLNVNCYQRTWMYIQVLWCYAV